MIRQLVATLAEAGVETDAEAIADALWLVRARRDEPENGDHQHAPAIRSASTEPRPPDAEPQHPPDSAQAVSDRGSGRGPDGPARASQPASGPGAAASSITLQRARALPGALELGRALRPLKQRHSSKRHHVLDAEATVEYFCDTGVLTPVMRPGAERWFDVDVLIDAGPSMAVWQETGMELVSLLARHGAFREVRHWTLDQLDGKVRLSRAAGVRSEAPQLVDPGARRLTMVVTDCIGPMWYQAQIWDAIRAWGLFSPVVIVTMLPSRLWPRTALGSSEVIMRSHQPGTANRSLDAALPWWWPNDDPSQPSMPVPVITLEAGPVAAWARVVMGAGGVEVPGVLAKPPSGKTAAGSGHAPPDAEERVQRFRVTMSPIAYRLAVYLAAALHGRWDLALARLVQEAMLPDSSQVHLAEVIVGGLVRQAKRHTRNEEPMYEFVDGVPNVLQRSLTSTEALQVLQALGGHIERETGHSPGIAAMLLGETAPANATEQFEDVRAGAANLIQTIGLAPGSTEIDQRTEEDGDRVTPDPLVLIVDDLAQNVGLLDAVLSPKGFRVATASSGAEALDLLGREHPDLVLLDTLLPGMDGYEICRRIREDQATAFLPVIMITASGEEEKIRAIEAGADDFINKPFDQAELLARVRSLVRVKRYHDTIEHQAAELAHCKRELERQSAALEIADRHKSEFLASMSHELRTPLNAIIGFSEVLLERMFGELNERQDEYLRDIWSSGKHLLELLNDILDLSKIEAGRLVLNRSEFAVRESLEYCLSMVRERALKKRIQLSLEVDPEVGLLDADRLRFRQVVLNLLSNAVKFTPDGGRVDVHASIQGQDLIVTVTDTGVGVPAEDRERIFDSFKQGTWPSGQAEGTGLGLTLSKRILELHEGRIWVESEVGRGSTFGFALPAGSGEPALASVPQAGLDSDVITGPAPGPGPTVVVVEDDRRSFDLLRVYLEAAGARVVSARDGEEGLDTVRRLSPAGVVLDILLPGVDGWDVLAQLKADPATAAIPVIMVSMLDERGRGFALGAAEYLVKPVAKEQLLAAIYRAAAVPEQQHTVVAIDDDPLAIELAKASLEPEGWTVLGAGTGQEGLALIRERQPSAVVLNLLMPGMDGFEVVEALRADHDTKSVPVVILTSKSMTQQDKERLQGRIRYVARKTEFGLSGLAGLVRWASTSQEPPAPELG